ncbi:MAG: hypothetical protein A2248_06935 [Candidatus Raymondbacteria bacterium RIFOXYA2_FULL_49_16]|nr:MAG: hypothetical protein A2248_06935 [Candidatus Raymondbacteria bacterium RIFOXYA2_FULL_49_16]
MKEIKVRDLQAGAVAEMDYFGQNGKILLKKGVSITDTLLNALSRRNVFSLFVQEEGEDIKKLLSLKELDTFEIEEEVVVEAPTEEEAGQAKKPRQFQPIHISIPVEQVIPELGRIEKGEEGIKQILNTAPVKNVEDAIEKNRITLAVVPEGTAIKGVAKELSFGQRTETYKASVVDQYSASVTDTKELLMRIRAGQHISGDSIKHIVKSFIDTYLNDKHMLINLSNARSPEQDYVFSHSLNVCLMAISIAASQGFNKEQVLDIGIGAFLHDVGALFIPEEIRFKAGPLSADELYEVKKHPMVGVHAIERIKNLPATAAFVCYQSHERENRQGYPKQRGGRLIHNFAKIVSIADVYESLTADRPYRKGLVPYKAMEFILRATKNLFFDSGIVKAFLEFASLFPVGSLVKLNTGEIAKVIRSNHEHYARPVVSVLVDAYNQPIDEKDIRTVDLNTQSSVRIVMPIDNTKLNIGVMKGF